MTKYRIGIIGYGDFTKVLVEHLAPYADIVVSSRSRTSGDVGHGARFVTAEEALGCPIIIPSIPAQFYDSFFRQHQAAINPTALVIDVASVKVRPLEMLEALLPPECQIIGTHPMFGPASIERNGGIVGLKCAVCPVRIDSTQFDTFTEFLGMTLGLRVIHTTAQQHDKEMAYVQGLSHYIGHVMDAMDIPTSQLATLAYDDLLDMKHIQGGDSWDLFHSIMHENPYSKEVHQEFLAVCEQLDRQLFTEKE